MAFTGTPIVKRVSDSLVRITGISLDASAVGTISLHDGAGDIKLPADFQPTVYAGQGNSGPVTLQDSIELSYLPGVNVGVVKSGATKQNWLATLTNNHGQASSAPVTVNTTVSTTVTGGDPGPEIAMFYGQPTGEGNTGADDYVANLNPGERIPFPRVGPAVGGGITALDDTQWTLPETGTYRVSWQMNLHWPSQLLLALNGAEVPTTCSASAFQPPSTEQNNVDAQNSNDVLIEAEAGDVLSLLIPAGNPEYNRVKEGDPPQNQAQAPNLLIELLRPAAPLVAESVAVSVASGGGSFTPTATGPLEIYIRHH